jgi:hypothetical protein
MHQLGKVKLTFDKGLSDFVRPMRQASTRSMGDQGAGQLQLREGQQGGQRMI